MKAQGYAFVDSIISSTEHSRSVIPSARLALAAVRRYRRVMDEQLDKILVTTMNDVPGYEIVAVYGEVFGLIVRARNVFSNFGASLRTLVGGEVGGYTTLLSDSRNHAIERLRAAALEKGANAVVAMRFDCNEIANLMSEIAAYGTAVTIRKK
ncbi:MAG: heavy metal-binding domain-containing protein [Candidatus Binatus sp.]|uniref:YbjQ family protein n=1 Tax=Candidatus Binatus sp. TaxID=2811406 RepID=UPI003BB1C7DF